MDVSRGTVIIDACAYWQRNLGCVNNNVAHEVFHRHRHSIYEAIRKMLLKETMITHRCPVKDSYPQGVSVWTDTDRIEWQASRMAPRILMP